MTTGIALIGTAMLLASVTADAASLYVSPEGDDAAAGTMERPFASLERARDEIRAVKAAGRFPETGVTVELLGSIYPMVRALKLTADDGGTPRGPVVYRAPRGIAARIIGGSVVTGWKPVADRAVLKRLDPAARRHVVQADLKALGITDYGEVKSAPNWANSDPGLELFFDDRPMTVARWPNEGYAYIRDIVVKDGHNIFGIPGSMTGKFLYEGDRPARWVDEPDIMLHGYWFLDWADQRIKVASIDTEAQEITLDDVKHGFGFRKGQWYYAYNLLCELDQPGEWYLDREKGVLYFWPPSPVEKAASMVSLVSGLVEMDGVSNARFEGLTLECARGTGITITNGTDVGIERCVIRNIGGQAVRVSGGARCGVRGCDIYQMADGGIDLAGGDRPALTPAGHYADNNHIHHLSRWNPLYHPGIQVSGVGQRVSHNLIHDLPHVAIGFTGNEHTIEYNEIHSVVYQANDAGAIYTTGADEDWTMRGHVIRHNYLHHIYGFEGRGCNGVYLDDAFSSILLHGNVFYQVPRAAFIGSGRDNIVEDNLFIDCNPAIHVDARGLGWMAYLEPYLKQKLDEMPYRQPPWSTRYPELLTLLDDEPMAPKGNVFRRNISWRGTWDEIEELARPHIRFEDNLVDMDPCFVDEGTLDFRFRDDSPGRQIRFRQIPFARIGLYDDEARASWPVVSTPRPHPPAPVPVKVEPRYTDPLPVAKATGPIAIDGVIGDGEWPGGEVALADTPLRGALEGAPCVARLAHDRDTLYVAVRVPLKDPSALRNGEVWGQDDGVEVCFRPPDSARPTFIVQGFPTGAYRGTQHAGASAAQAEALGKATRFTAHVIGDGWTCEFAIPLGSVDIEPVAGLKLLFNIGVRRSETGEWVAWAGAMGPNFAVEAAGSIVLE